MINLKNKLFYLNCFLKTKINKLEKEIQIIKDLLDFKEYELNKNKILDKEIIEDKKNIKYENIIENYIIDNKIDNKIDEILDKIKEEEKEIVKESKFEKKKRLEKEKKIRENKKKENLKKLEKAYIVNNKKKKSTIQKNIDKINNQKFIVDNNVNKEFFKQNNNKNEIKIENEKLEIEKIEENIEKEFKNIEIIKDNKIMDLKNFLLEKKMSKNKKYDFNKIEKWCKKIYKIKSNIKQYNNDNTLIYLSNYLSQKYNLDTISYENYFEHKELKYLNNLINEYEIEIELLNNYFKNNNKKIDKNIIKEIFKLYFIFDKCNIYLKKYDINTNRSINLFNSFYNLINKSKLEIFNIISMKLKNKDFKIEDLKFVIEYLKFYSYLNFGYYKHCIVLKKD